MSATEMPAASSAYAYPLLIKQLLHTPLALAPDQEIVYRDQLRYRYRDFRGRLDRLANALARLGVNAGSVVAVMDWDSHRYLECYFAVPMMGVPDARWGERPLALVVARADAKTTASAEAIKAHLRAFAGAGTLSKAAIPERILFVEALDKTSVGKLDKKTLRQKYGG